MESYTKINNRFGPFTIDRFADNVNTKVRRFNSRFYCPETENVDAFTEDWARENNWLCPPISLIGCVIRHLRICRAKGTLLIPVWQSAYFWPIIYPDGLHLSNFVKDFIVLRPFYISYCSNNVFSGYVDFSTIALQIVF